jgi:hypothetical protein
LSHKHSRHHRPRREFTWLLIAGGAVLLTLAVFLFARKPAPEETGNPQLAVDQQKIDYGYVNFGETRQFKIAVTNTGDGVLRFEEKPYVEVVEGC